MRRLFGLVVVAAAGGCGNLFNQHAQMMDAMRGVMSDTAARLASSGSGQIAAGGHVINPGLRVAGGVEYYAVAQYQGVAGQVQASMAGGLDRAVPPEVQARSDAIWRDTSLSAAEKVRLTAELLRQWMEREGAIGAPGENAPPTTAPAGDVASAAEGGAGPTEVEAGPAVETGVLPPRTSAETTREFEFHVEPTETESADATTGHEM